MSPCLAGTSFTSVSGDESTSSGEVINSKAAVVITALTLCHGCSVLKRIDLVDGEHGRVSTGLMSLAGNKCSTKSSHDTCDIRSDSFASCNLFKGTEYSIIIESSTLNYDVLSEFTGVTYLDYLEERIFNYRICKSGRNVGNRCSFFLCLLYAGIHEYGASCTEIYGVLGKKSFLCKIFNFKIK